MQYQFVLLEDFFKSWQIEYINLLETCGLLGKFTPDCKKIMLYLFLTNINKLLENKQLLFYHVEQLSPDLEVFQFIDYDKFNAFFNKVVYKIRSLTGKIFMLSQTKRSLIQQANHVSELDGCIQDEILVLGTIEPNPKLLKDFLSSLNLKEIFKDMAWKCC